MIELRFHEDLYDGFAVDEAVKVYADFLSADLDRGEKAWIVRLTAGARAAEEGVDEPTLAAELANYALGKTIERSRAEAAPAAAPGGQGA